MKFKEDFEYHIEELINNGYLIRIIYKSLDMIDPTKHKIYIQIDDMSNKNKGLKFNAT